MEKGSSANSNVIPDEVIDKMVFKFAHIVYVKAKDCDLEFATKGGTVDVCVFCLFIFIIHFYQCPVLLQAFSFFTI